jgi:DNA modification methylase
MPPPGRRTGDTIKPFWQTTDGSTVRLYHGNVLGVLARLPAKSVHCVVTSPPYWGLRDYGTGEWQGGDQQCDHIRPGKPCSTYKTKDELRDGDPIAQFGNQYSDTCGKCGAVREDHQMGREKTPQEYVERMVGVFEQIKRVLRDDGTVWLNLGDSYASGGRGSYDNTSPNKGNGKPPRSRPDDGIPSGNLVGIPWRVALALQAAGWVLRQDIIWHKPSPMPESVKNRCTKAHEYLFLLTKGMGYYYDAEAIKETKPNVGKSGSKERRFEQNVNGEAGIGHSVPWEGNTSNKRSVWTVSSQGYEGAHFATFPLKLIEPCILAGTSEKGCCAQCGAPWRRLVEELGAVGGHQHGRRGGESNPYALESQTGLAAGGAGANWLTKTIGWEPGCECGATVVPCTVLDPFIGSGTTCVVSLEHGRRSVGIDLSEKYLRNNAVPRIEGALLSRPATARLAGKERKVFTGGVNLLKTG